MQAVQAVHKRVESASERERQGDREKRENEVNAQLKRLKI